jgi:Ca2+-binding EF-hand superfamily protein
MIKCVILCAGNGYITTDVLREILKELDDKITAEDLDMMIEEIDSDGSGTVDFDGEFVFNNLTIMLIYNIIN